jgi:RNA-directed DNA polymerase
LQKRNFKEIFQIYFHDKYSYNDFLNIQLVNGENITKNSYNNNITYSYKIVNNKYELKNYHTFLNNLIFAKLNLHNNVYSYRENHTILQMLTNHKNDKYFFTTDIKNFFGSITKNMIKDCLITDIKNLPIEHILNIITVDGTLPAGFVTSPSISNVILFKFDDEITKYCNSNNVTYSRYSDDLVFSSDDRLDDINNIVQKILSKYYNNSFILNNNKSKYLDKTKLLKILGLVITPEGHITVPKKEKENIKKLIYFYMNDQNKFNIFLKENYNTSIAKAYGKLNYINDIDINFIQYLRKKYGNFVIDKFMHGDKRVG